MMSVLFILFAVCSSLVDSVAKEQNDWQLDGSSLLMRMSETLADGQEQLQQLRKEIRDLAESLRSVNHGLRTERNAKSFLKRSDKNLKRNEEMMDLQLLVGETVSGIHRDSKNVVRDLVGENDAKIAADVCSNNSQHLENVKTAILQAINPCYTSPCLNGGTCYAVAVTGTCSGTAQCACPDNYIGHFCQVFKACRQLPCYHGGTCSARGGDPHCDCLDWFSGAQCEHAVCPVLVQQRLDDSPFFDRTWQEFKVGFGDASGNYWMGNERLHQMTESFPYRLRIDLQSLHNQQWYLAEYGRVKVSSENTDYSLELGYFSGNVSNDYMNAGTYGGIKFSTKDHGSVYDRNCAVNFVGGFWFRDCYDSFGMINAAREPTRDSFKWFGLPGGWSLKATRMWLTC